MNKKLKLALASSHADTPVVFDFYFGGELIYKGLSVSNSITDPYILEYVFEDTINHEFSFILKNIKMTSPEDLHLILSYCQISDENFVYPAHTYVVRAEKGQIRKSNNTLYTEEVWLRDGFESFTFNTDGLDLFYDEYGANLANQ